MELNAKPTDTSTVLVHDKILMALLAANGIKAEHTFSTGWPDDPPEIEREVYMVYHFTLRLMHLIETYESRKVTVNLDDYLSSADELENYVGKLNYLPGAFNGNDKDNLKTYKDCVHVQST